MRSLSVLVAALAMTTPAMADLDVAYLAQEPVIDGKLDPALQALARHDFPVREASTTLPADWAPTYRIGYGAGFLYLYVEVPDAQLVTRDRAYQNGDGYILVLTLPRADGAPSEEFSVLGFTASGKPVAEWQKKFRWYHNKDLAFETVKEAETASFSANGRTGMELKLPWSAVAPLHPWLSPAIGFNLSYVKAEGETGHSDFLVTEDERIQNEQSPRRSVLLRFAPPADTAFRSFVALARNNLEQGGQAEALIAVYAPRQGELKAVARLLDGEQEIVAHAGDTLRIPQGLSLQTLALPSTELPAGGYAVQWGGDLEGLPASGLTLLPPFDPARIEERIANISARIAAGSAATLAFKLQQIKEARARLHAYDTAGGLRIMTAELQDLVARAEKGEDAIAAQRGTLRRAFRSKVDGTLQPYTVHLPARIEPRRKYPLIVFLHGSGEDDRRALDIARFPKDAILLAPFGRGTSNAFAADHAQEDVREAVEDVTAIYPVDAARVVVSGFSMGGYGAYRTFDAGRGRYRAVAIFSGHPSLGRQWIGKAAPDYLDPKALSAFRGAAVFIFHGGKDRNCPIELTREMVAKLRAAGAKVTFEYDPDKGHEAPSPKSVAAFQDWLAGVLR